MSSNVYIDSSSSNNSDRSSRIVKDLNLNFLAHPVKKDIQRIYDIEAVKRSVRNLLLLNQFDKPFHPEIYCGITEFLFEPFSPFVADIMEARIISVLNRYEPRVKLESVEITDNSDSNELKITLEFYVLNVKSDLITLETILERT